MNYIDKEKKVVFIAYLCNYGGIETMIIRMSKWLTKNNILTEVLGDKDRKVDERLMDELIHSGAKVSLISYRHKDKSLKEIKERYNSGSVQCICFSYIELIIADELFGSNKNANILFYDANQFNLVADFHVSGALKKRVFRFGSKIINKRLYFDHKIVFMDPLCKKRTLEEYNLGNRFDDDIIYLPLEINDYSDLKIKERKIDNKEFRILTICRFVFPFKGYVFGLLSLFLQLEPFYPQLRLVVIGTGKDEDMYAQKLDVLDDKIRNKITWIKGVPYEHLQDYISEAQLYVGMGTTVIDAVNLGVPALPIGSYTYECKGYDFFYKDPANLGGIGGNVDIREYVEAVLNMSTDDYSILSKKDHDALLETYDINSVAKKLLNYQNVKNNRVFNAFERLMVNLIKARTK